MPLATYATIEKLCREKGFNVYLIGMVSTSSFQLVDEEQVSI
jgi:hypothetical protein